MAPASDKRRSMKRVRALGGAFAAVFLLLLVASPGFSQGNQAANIDQWANGTPTKAPEWQNGDLGPSNSHYREDYVVPYRAILTNLVIGHSYKIAIEWDTTKSGLHSQDYLMSYDATESGLPAPFPCIGSV